MVELLVHNMAKWEMAAGGNDIKRHKEPARRSTVSLFCPSTVSHMARLSVDGFLSAAGRRAPSDKNRRMTVKRPLSHPLNTCVEIE